jgi:hypothetical protein
LTLLLARFGIRTYHARRLRGRQYRPFHLEFVNLLEKHVPYGVVASLTPSDYRTIYKADGTPRKLRQDTEYGLCLRICLLAALRFISDKHDGWPLTFVLEKGHQNKEDAIRVFHDVKGGLPRELEGALGAIDFESKETCIPLASADALANLNYRIGSGAISNPAAGQLLPPNYRGLRMQRFMITQQTLSELRSLQIQGLARRPSPPPTPAR